MIPSRLDKYLADSTALSRSEIERASKADRISLTTPNGQTNTSPLLWTLVFEEDDVRLDGDVVEPNEPQHYFVLNKPVGVLTTASDPHGRLSLEPWLRRLPPTVFPVGRLDRATTGLLLLTDDGDLSFVLLRPQFHVDKRYRLTLSGQISEHDERFGQLMRGVDIGSGPARALDVTLVGGTHDKSLVDLVIDEGRNRVVRKMCRRVGLQLEHLHRAAIGPVRLESVRRGDWRELRQDEVDALWSAGGGRLRARQRKIAALREQAERWRKQERPYERLEAWLRHHARSSM